MGYKLSDRSYVQPDVSITHRGQAIEKYLLGSPAIAIEMTPLSIDAKAQLYFRFGAREVWHMHPKTHYIVVHIPKSARIERELLRTPLLPGFALDIPALFAR